LALREWDKKDVAADVLAHDLDHLRTGDVREAVDLDVVARLDAEAPGVLAVAIRRGCSNRKNENCPEGQHAPGEVRRSFLRESAPADGNALLCAQERRLLVGVEVQKTRVVQLLPRRLVAERVQLFLRDGGTAFSRHQYRSVVGSEPQSELTITAFRKVR
jgi:hypothetical protein